MDPFDPRPFRDYLISSPLAALLYPLHHLLLRLRGPPQRPTSSSPSIRVVCISDTHTHQWAPIPDGDLLIHAGDLSNDGSVHEIQAAVNWLKSLPHLHKVVVSGNHDGYFDPRSRSDEDRHKSIDWGDIHYLQHSSVKLSFPATPTKEVNSTPDTDANTNVRTLTVYGAPQIPAIVPFGPEHAFTYPPDRDRWTGTIPSHTDILVTHTPPENHLDLSPVYSTGCPYLLSEIWRVRPALHVMGHVHAAYGSEPVFWDEAQRAWECLSASRRERAKFPTRWALLGFLRDLLDLAGWFDAINVIFYGVLGVVWARVWRGESRGGWMVNAACTFRNTGQLRNPPQVVVL